MSYESVRQLELRAKAAMLGRIDEAMRARAVASDELYAAGGAA